jgi:cell division protein FtsZ
VEGARGVVFNITGGSDLTLHEVNAAAETIYEVVDPNANIIFGAVIDDRMQGEIRITVIATGFSGDVQPVVPATKTAPPPRRPLTPTPTPPPPTTEPKSAPGLDIPEFLQRRRPPR